MTKRITVRELRRVLRGVPSNAEIDFVFADGCYVDDEGIQTSVQVFEGMDKDRSGWMDAPRGDTPLLNIWITEEQEPRDKDYPKKPRKFPRLYSKFPTRYMHIVGCWSRFHQFLIGLGLAQPRPRGKEIVHGRVV